MSCDSAGGPALPVRGGEKQTRLRRRKTRGRGCEKGYFLRLESDFLGWNHSPDGGLWEKAE
ncbi:hypothetical protein NHX12_030922 [Muraenolepis orangiensis]|uniref:Uncharacterized protein n=1 Tax=Muraenolepis orangiensis TaxID=630683 RepID=A0A9Q0EAU2_9TELE|nr:hypothetical protein NHX12_030922 [Muraenolepis orangiensis]